MASPRIFIPNAQGESPAAALARVGLGSLLFEGDWPLGQGTLVGGPEGMRGLCVSWEPTLQRPGVEHPRYEFSAERDIAIRAPAEPTHQLAAGRFWWLFEPARPVTPLDLKRKPRDEQLRGAIASAKDAPEVIRAKTARLSAMTYFAGEAVELNDGQHWTLPNMAALPCELRYDPTTSQWTNDVAGEVRPIYDRLLKLFEHCQRHLLHEFTSRHTPDEAASVADEFTSGIKPEPLDDLKDAWPFVCEMLALNYRVTPWLVDHLKLLDRSILWDSLCALTNARALNSLYVHLQKKSDLLRRRGSPSNSGNAGS